MSQKVSTNKAFEIRTVFFMLDTRWCDPAIVVPEKGEQCVTSSSKTQGYPEIFGQFLVKIEAPAVNVVLGTELMEEAQIHRILTVSVDHCCAFLHWPRPMSDKDQSPLRAAVFTTVKAAVLIGAMSVLAANWLSHGGLDRSGLGRLAQHSGSAWVDPVTTGAISTSAAGTKLDPCVARPDRKR